MVDDVPGLRRLDSHAHGRDWRRRRNLARIAQATIPKKRHTVLHTLLRLDEVAPLCGPDLWLVLDHLDPERNDPDQHVSDLGVDECVKTRRKQWRGFHHGKSRRFYQVINDKGDGERHYRRSLKV